MSEAPKILLAHQLKLLKLPTFLREYEKLARQCAAEGLDHIQFLARLVELELIDRERRTIERRIKAANFPAVKSLDSFDFKATSASFSFTMARRAPATPPSPTTKYTAAGMSPVQSWVIRMSPVRCLSRRRTPAASGSVE